MTTLTVPLVLPVVEVTVEETGELQVALDTQPYEVPDNVVPSGRAGLGRVLAEITAQLGSPIRVEIREADGSLFTDIVTPPTADPAPAQPGYPTPDPMAGAPGVGLAMDGFSPSEPVAVAVIVAQTLADTNGGVELRLPAALLAKHADRLVLVGQTSGTVAFSEDTHAEPAAGSVA